MTYRYKRRGPAQIPLKVAAHEVGHAITQLAIDEWPGVLPGPWIDTIEVTSSLTGIVSRTYPGPSPVAGGAH